MPKIIKKCFYEKLTFENLLKAHYRASFNKTNRSELLKFNIDLETNIINILISLKNGTYKLSEYKTFNIYEPKERIIKYFPYKDRIVQQWYIYEFIKPYIIPRLIDTTCACIDNRGAHYAVKLTQKYMRIMKRKYNEYYILKLDIKKYFYNIDKGILYNIMSEYISDKLLLDLTRKFIYDNDESVSIPIGNYTSQYFANIYLDKLDKYIKEELKVKYYVRYMDDMILLIKDKEEAILLKDKISLLLKERLHLELNYKSRYYPNKMGINFCGYRIYETHILIRNRSKKKIKKKIRKWNKEYDNNVLNVNELILSFNSWIAHSSHTNSYNITNKYKSKIKYFINIIIENNH